MSVTVVTILVLIAMFLITLILFICQRNKNKEISEQLQRKTEAYNGLYEEFELYKKAEQFKAKKEEEANEKIDNLHSGKLSADDILPHK